MARTIYIIAIASMLASCSEGGGGGDAWLDPADGDSQGEDPGTDPGDIPGEEGAGPCTGRPDGTWCDGADLVTCAGGEETGRETCPLGCETVAGGARCIESVCIEEPDPVSPDPPIEICNYMDWKLSSDGHYLISQFGTTNDPTTLGHTTSCGWLQGHYDGWGCRYDVRSGTCLSDDYDIPWIYGHVDWDYDEVIAAVDASMDGDVPYPEYFYVACAQRFGCGSLLRVTNTENGRCVVVYVEDGGPNGTYEDVGYGERRILDSSPAVVRYLEVEHVGWLNSTLMYVEWGLSGDVPGQGCTRCESTPAGYGYPWGGTPFDVNHMMDLACREEVCGDGTCGPGESHSSCPEDCPECVSIPAEGRIVDEVDPCFYAGGSPSSWRSVASGYGGSLLWTYATDASTADNHGIWTLIFDVEGDYTLEAYTEASYAESVQAAYQVTHAGATDSSVVDQTAIDGWSTIGTFHFVAGAGQSVRLDDNTGEPLAGRVQIVFDAVRVSP